MQLTDSHMSLIHQALARFPLLGRRKAFNRCMWRPRVQLALAPCKLSGGCGCLTLVISMRVQELSVHFRLPSSGFCVDLAMQGLNGNDFLLVAQPYLHSRTHAHSQVPGDNRSPLRWHRCNGTQHARLSGLRRMHTMHGYMLRSLPYCCCTENSDSHASLYTRGAKYIAIGPLGWSW